MPGIMDWQSPKYFGYFPGSINITTPMAQMFNSSFHSPGFNFAVAPAYTELENIMMDWCVQALGLPDKFLLKNAGGGIIGNNVTESVMLSINAAKHRVLKRLNIEGNNPKILKLVGYYSEQCHPGA
jgi:aromatic-L-amino-acid/L-tryptophan decarboxylase